MMINDSDGSLGRAMALSGAESAGKRAQEDVDRLARRVADLEREVLALRNAWAKMAPDRR